MDKKNFLKLMTGLSKGFRTNIDEDTIAIYYEFLKDIRYDTLKEAFKRTIETKQFFPSIAEIRKEVAKLENPELALNAEDEWEEVIKAIKNYDIYDSENAMASLKPITRRVLGMAGGWQNVCMTEDIKWFKKDFIKLFNREIGKAEEIEMLGSSAEQREIEYRNELLKEEKEIERQNQIGMEW